MTSQLPLARASTQGQSLPHCSLNGGLSTMRSGERLYMRDPPRLLNSHESLGIHVIVPAGKNDARSVDARNMRDAQRLMNGPSRKVSWHSYSPQASMHSKCHQYPSKFVARRKSLSRASCRKSPAEALTAASHELPCKFTLSPDFPKNCAAATADSIITGSNSCDSIIISSGRRRGRNSSSSKSRSTSRCRASTPDSAESSLRDSSVEVSESDPEVLRQIAAGARAATQVEEREATQLLRAAEAALGLLQKAAQPGEGGKETAPPSDPNWGQWGKWGRWGRWGWPKSEQGTGEQGSVGQGAEGVEGSKGSGDDDDEQGQKGLWTETQRREILRSINLGQVKDAQQLLQLLSQTAESPATSASPSRQGVGGGGVVLTMEAVMWLLDAALSARNAALAHSIVDACRDTRTAPVIHSSGFQYQPTEGGSSASTSPEGSCLQWPSVDMIPLYCLLVSGLAAMLRVSDAVAVVEEVRRRGVPLSDEVSFGHVVGCPTCQRPLAVVQPQYGRQVVPCALCRYEFELVSGNLVTCDSESLLEGPTTWERALRLLRIKSGALPNAIHSAVMKLPNGTSEIRTFATSTPSVPAQEGERITLICASPADSSRRRRGLLRALPIGAAARAPGWRAGEAMQLDNHRTGQTLPLLRAPPQSAKGSQPPSWLLPGALFLTANATAGAVFIDPQLPAVIAAVALAGAAGGTAVTTFITPQLNKLPAGSVAATSARQELLKQYAALEERLCSLTTAAADEVRMVARLWQLQNKMEAVGEPATYSARLERVVAAKEGLQQRLDARLQLIDSYAKISAMIEIEVEMESDVPTAEAAGAVASIADQIERLMEVESLQKEWRIQAEANDDVERLLRSAPPLQPDA